MTAYSRAYTNSTSTKGEGKKKTADSQMKERGSGLKTMSNVILKQKESFHVLCLFYNNFL